MSRPNNSRRQSGVSLVFALLALVAMTLGAVALIRSVDTGILALGNLSFKQSGVTAGARAADQALAFLEANILTGVLDKDMANKGYYATSRDTLDATGRSVGTATVLAQVDWDANGCKVNGQDSGTGSCSQASDVIDIGGDKARYIITRLCSQELNFMDKANTCSSPMVSGSTKANARGGLDYNDPDPIGSSTYSPYFRIITRTVGPKGTVSFTETLVHF